MKVNFDTDIMKTKADMLASIAMPIVEKEKPKPISLPPMLRYTWQDIDHAVSSGQNLIVANQKEVYDISQWVALHPGGQSILNTVSGTDVTSEFFALILPPPPPKVIVAPNLSKRRVVSSMHQRQSKNLKSASLIMSPIRQSVLLDSPSPSNLQYTDEDFVKIQKARRIHQHTHTASMKMQTFRIGDLVSNGEHLVSADPNEYKRYAITEKTLISTPTWNQSVYKIRFCLMNPDESERVNSQFKIGECVEIQCKIGRSFVSRYYTPVKGTLSCFEIIVKIRDVGQFTPFLQVSKPGDRQFKVRGGFGEQLFKDDAYAFIDNSTHFQDMMWGDNIKQWMPDRIYFVCAGTGITPFIQCINTYLMPIGQTQWVNLIFIKLI